MFKNCKWALVLLTWMLAAHQVIAEKLLDYLRTTTDDAQKADVAKRIGELAERFAPDTQWFIDTMNQVSWLPPSYCSSKAFTSLTLPGQTPHHFHILKNHPFLDMTTRVESYDERT